MHATLTAVDASWLYLEASEPPMNVSLLLTVEGSGWPGGRLGLDALRALVEGRLHLLPRLRQRPALPPNPAERPVWVDDPTFDLGAHLHETAVPGSEEAAALGAVAAAVHVEPLGLGRPLWEVHVLQSASGRTAGILAKWHHALADAMAGLVMMRRLLETGTGTRGDALAPWAPRPVPAPFELLAEGDGTDARRRLRELTADPAALGDDVRPVFLALEALLATGSPPPGLLGRSAAAARRVAFATLAFAEARRTRVALGTSMTELFLTLAAGALSRLFAGRGVDAASVRVMVPLLAGSERSGRESGHHARYVFFDLPVGPMEEPVRLRLVSERLSGARSAHDPRNGPDGAHLIVTYLAGPLGAVEMAGARLLSAHSLVPTGRSIPLGVATVSMGDAIGLTFTGDAAQLPDIDRLAAGVAGCYTELGAAAGTT